MVSLRVAVLSLFLVHFGPALAAPDPLLAAVTFALTGKDKADVTFLDRPNCIVIYRHPYDNFFNVKTYYLNNIDPSRIKYTMWKKVNPYGHDRFNITLFGQNTILEEKYGNPKWKDSNFSTTTLELETSEEERMVRAWRTIYSSGCKASHSAF